MNQRIRSEPDPPDVLDGVEVGAVGTSLTQERDCYLKTVQINVEGCSSLAKVLCEVGCTVFHQSDQDRD